ncbi:hypothetical protein CRENPOLYSF2_1440007 [Crenothrix polyspora]|uniref:Uncharacterized protein n=1 Tax=Crenothrix polyspora TaxID=360316 RepID=A0A1R4H1D2_9GAMM|nr:hypothetical protein CRENPOLYSF2_1440007 [Crenothrix polyspora]
MIKSSSVQVKNSFALKHPRYGKQQGFSDKTAITCTMGMDNTRLGKNAHTDNIKNRFP